MADTQKQIVTVGVTGASGAILAQKMLVMLEEDPRVTCIHLVVTEAGQRLFAEELNITSGDLKQLPSRILGHPVAKTEVLPNKDVGASIASGSSAVDAMVVIPCSMGTLGAIANGISDDLVARAADVMLKESRKLVLCVRDTPFNRVHLENMLRAQQAGAVIMPTVPAFYHQPKTIDDLVTQYVCRVLAQISKMANRIKTVLEMIKFEHSVFALPFALTGALLAARATHRPPRGWPSLRQVLWIVVAMVAARSAAMTMNRIADLRYDRENPRTKERALATGSLTLQFAGLFTIAAVAVFFVAASQLNPLTLKLAPLAIAVLFFYSFTKRFTNWSHLFLGFALGISPAAAWIAITGGLDPRMLILCAAVTLWVGGFDVLYACQDIEYDQRAGLFSVPKKFGIANALLIARVMHLGVIALLSWLAFSFGLPWPAWAGIVVVAALLYYEHSLVKAEDLSKLDAAFFTVNGYISMLFLLFWGAAAAVWRV